MKIILIALFAFGIGFYSGFVAKAQRKLDAILFNQFVIMVGQERILREVGIFDKEKEK